MVEVSQFLFLPCLMFLLTLSTVESLHLKLIHRDSIDSPFYPGNLTNAEKLQRLDNYSIATAQYYKTILSQSDFNTEELHPQVTHDTFLYVVELTVGTPRSGGMRRPSYKFVLDTAGGMMWLQCRPCRNCWKQELFNAENSATIEHIPCNHRLCDVRKPGWTCVQNNCQYHYGYARLQATIGFLASDTIGFSSNPTPEELIPDVVFGCSHLLEGTFVMPHDIDGVLGVSPSPLSLISQLQQNAGGHKFAYCLSHFASSPLRLGSFLQGPHVNTIRIRWSHLHPMHVYLPLRDVSIGNHSLNFAPGTFEPRQVGRGIQGGFIIASGSMFTCFPSGGPYERIMGAFMDHFNHHPGLEHVGAIAGFELCYHVVAGFHEFPNMVFHFGKSQDFNVQPENVFVVVADNTLCVGIRPVAGAALFGALQQKNHWISLDYTRERLSFAPSDCSHHV